MSYRFLIVSVLLALPGGCGDAEHLTVQQGAATNVVRPIPPTETNDLEHKVVPTLPGTQAPEIIVGLGQGANDYQVGGMISFGVVGAADDPTRRLFITNDGGGLLSVNPPQAGAGFLLSGELMVGPVELEPGASAALMIRVDKTKLGSHSIDLLISNNDIDESDFQLRLTAQVNLSASVMLDDTDAKFPASGWVDLEYYFPENGYRGVGGSARQSKMAEEPAVWTFRNLDRGAYRVLATWPTPTQGQLFEAVYVIHDGRNLDAPALLALAVNQRIRPLDVRTGEVSWSMLGTVAITSDSLTVAIHPPNPDFVIPDKGPFAVADAIRIERGSRRRSH